MVLIWSGCEMAGAAPQQQQQQLRALDNVFVVRIEVKKGQRRLYFNENKSVHALTCLSVA